MTPTHPHPPSTNTKQAKNLRIADLRSSDPYVKVRYGVNQKYDTKVRVAVWSTRLFVFVVVVVVVVVGVYVCVCVCLCVYLSAFARWLSADM
jgi:hypothetical protein